MNPREQKAQNSRLQGQKYHNAPFTQHFEERNAEAMLVKATTNVFIGQVKNNFLEIDFTLESDVTRSKH